MSSFYFFFFLYSLHFFSVKGFTIKHYNNIDEGKKIDFTKHFICSWFDVSNMYLRLSIYIIVNNKNSIFYLYSLTGSLLLNEIKIGLYWYAFNAPFYNLFFTHLWIYDDFSVLYCVIHLLCLLYEIYIKYYRVFGCSGKFILLSAACLKLHSNSLVHTRKADV